MFKYKNEMLPDIFRNFFIYTANVHNYNTRQCHKLFVPKYNCMSTYKTIRFKGVSIWNSIYEHVKCNYSIHSFKKHLKFYLLSIEM